MKTGKVYLVGAGPGDPGLLTIKGLECLKKANVIIYDRLLDDRLLYACRPNAEKIYAGKSVQSHHLITRSLWTTTCGPGKLYPTSHHPTKKRGAGRQNPGGDPPGRSQGSSLCLCLFEHDVSIAIVHLYRVPLDKLTPQQCKRQWILDLSLDDPLERSRAVDRVISGFGQILSGCVGQNQPDIALGQKAA